MYILTIAIGNIAVWQLRFSKQDAANAALKSVQAGATLEDDFGQKVRLGMNPFVGCYLENEEVTLKQRADKWIAEQKSQARAMSTLSQDPQIRAMQAVQQPPGMIRMNG